MQNYGEHGMCITEEAEEDRRQLMREHAFHINWQAR